MNWASYLLSLCLHLAVFLLIMFWPSSPPVNLETPPVLISLVVTALALLLPVLTIPLPHNTASFTIMLVSFCLLGIGKTGKTERK